MLAVANEIFSQKNVGLHAFDNIVNSYLLLHLF